MITPVYLAVACLLTLVGLAWTLAAVWRHNRAAIVAATGWTTFASGTICDAVYGGHWYTGSRLAYLGGTGIVVLGFGLLLLGLARRKTRRTGKRIAPLPNPTVH